MNLTTLIIVNAVLCAAVVYGLVSLLAHGIRSDRPAAEAEVRHLRRREATRLAA